MFDWLSDAVGGLASLFGGGADAGLSDASGFLSDPSFTLTGDAFTDAAGNAVSGANNFNGTTFSLGDDMRGVVADPTTGAVLGFNDGSGNLVDLAGNPVRPTSFGGFSSNLGGGPAGLQDAINGIRPSMGGGGSSTNVSLPKLDVPTSGIVPTTPTPGMAPSPVPQTAPNGQQSGFTPMTANVATAQAPQDAQGLRRLFAEALRGAA